MRLHRASNKFVHLEVAESGVGKRGIYVFEDGYNIRAVVLLRHGSVETTVIYTHVLNTGRCPARSPLDQLTTSELSGIGGSISPPIPAPLRPSATPQALPSHAVRDKNPAAALPR